MKTSSSIFAMALLAGAVAASESNSLRTEKDKLSYAMGMSVALQIQKFSAAMDPAVFRQAMADVENRKELRLNLKEAAVIVKEWQEKAKKNEITFHGDQIRAFQELAARNKEQGKAFLTENKTKEGIVSLESGVQYKILKAGNGRRPAGEDTVVCQYRGTLLDGKEFDSSYKRNEPATLAVQDVIPGWAEVLQLMPVGSHWLVFIPDTLAFGDRDPGGGIGPNTTLVLDLELLAIKGKSETPAKATASIDAKGTELSQRK